MNESPLLKIEDLTFSFRTYGGVVKAVRGVSFEVNAERNGRYRRREWMRKECDSTVHS